MCLIAKAIRISHAKFHCTRLTTEQDIRVSFLAHVYLGRCKHLPLLQTFDMTSFLILTADFLSPWARVRSGRNATSAIALSMPDPAHDQASNQISK